MVIGLAEVWVAAIGAVASVGATAYGAYSQNKAAKAAQGAGGSGGLSRGFMPLNLPDMPKLKPYDIDKLGVLGVNYDRHAYGLSDADFAQRHQPIVGAEKLFEAQTLKDQQGDSELMPALQNEYMRAGLQGALASFGNTPNVLAPGSAGEADVARNLGISITGLQDRNRDNRTKSLITAEELFPRRKFGLNGTDAVNLQVGNINNQNAWNQQQHAEQVQLAQYNATGQANFSNAQQQQSNVNAAASAQSSQANTQAIMSAAQMLAKLGTTYAGSRTGTASYGTVYPQYNVTGTAAATNAGWKANASGY